MREFDFGPINLERQNQEPSQNISHSIVREDGEVKSGGDRQISEILVNFGQIEEKQREKEHKGKDSGNSSKKSDLPAGRHGWEPFNQEPSSEQRFVNLYGGVFSAQMELNRKKAEELVRVAALEGQIVLTSLSAIRNRPFEANPDGSVTAKRRLPWGEKPTEDVENPYFRVASIGEGWRVEICDQRIHQELAERYSGEKLQKKFVARFNQYLRTAIWKIVKDEKLTSKKDHEIAIKWFNTIAFPLFEGGVLIFGSAYNLRSVLVIVGGLFFFFHPFINIIRKLGHDSHRNLTSFYEYLMPQIEFDRIGRGFLYLNLKGQI